MKLKLTFILFILFSFSFISIGQSVLNQFYNVKALDGNGIKFWNSDKYKIHMGDHINNSYGPVTSFSIKMNMGTNANTGWVWGPYNSKPVAALNTQGNFQIKGWMKIVSTRDASKHAGTGGLEIAGKLRLDGNEVITNANTALFLNQDNNGDVVIDANTLSLIHI